MDIPVTPRWASSDQLVLGKVGQGYAIGRLGTPGDIAGAVTYPMPPDAAWVTGQARNLDGRLPTAGRTSGPH